MNRAMTTEDYQLDWRETVATAIRRGQQTGFKRKVWMVRSRRFGWIAQSLPIPHPIGRTNG